MKKKTVKAWAVVHAKSQKGFEDITERMDGAVGVFWEKESAANYRIVGREKIIPCTITYKLPA